MNGAKVCFNICLVVQHGYLSSKITDHKSDVRLVSIIKILIKQHRNLYKNNNTHISYSFEQSRAEYSRAEQGRAEQDRAGQDRTGHSKAQSRAMQSKAQQGTVLHFVPIHTQHSSVLCPHTHITPYYSHYTSRHDITLRYSVYVY